METGTVEKLAVQALELAEDALLARLRFMNAAFARLHPLPLPPISASTRTTWRAATPPSPPSSPAPCCT